MDGRGFHLEELTPGLSRERRRQVSESDVTAFSEVSGDRNPVHLDEPYALTTRFKGRIAHGMLSAALISAVLGMDLPGPGAVYLSQTLKFRRPVRIGDEVLAKATVVSLDEAASTARLRTECFVGGKLVLEGEAEVLVPRAGAAG